MQEESRGDDFTSFASVLNKTCFGCQETAHWKVNVLMSNEQRNFSSRVQLSGHFFFLSLQSTLRISPPLPYLASSMQKDLLRLGSRLDPQDSSSPLTPPSSASPASSAIFRRWRSGSPWPGADMLDQSDDAFSIEREARLHRQAAGASNASNLTFFVCGVHDGCSDFEARSDLNVCSLLFNGLVSCERSHVHLEWAAPPEKQQGSSVLLQGLSWWCALGHHRR